MKIGVRAHDFGKHPPETLASLIRSAGFEAVHLALYKALDVREEEMLTPQMLIRIRSVFEQAGLEISVLGCYVDPGSPDDSIYHDGMEKFRAHLKIANALGAGCVATETTMFCGSELEREMAYERVLSFVREMAVEAKRYDTYAAIEPVLVHTIHTPKMMKRLLDEADSSRVKVIFDPLNLLSPEHVLRQEELWEECIKSFGSSAIAMHIKDGRLVNGRYVPVTLGEGVMRFQNILNWAKEYMPSLPLLREEADPQNAAQEIRFLRDLLQLKA